MYWPRAAYVIAGLAAFLGAAVLGAVLRHHSARQLNPADVATHTLAAARAALERGAHAEAVRLTRGVPDDAPQGPQARLVEGTALWKSSRWQGAERAWRRAIELDPQTPEAGWLLLNLFFVEQRWSDAERLAFELYRHEPDPKDQVLLLLELIRQVHERVGPSPTVVAVEPVIVQEPDNFHAHRVLGLSYVYLGRTREGLQSIERAIALRQDDAEGWATLVSCLVEAGESSQLAEVWQRMPTTARDDPRIQRSRGTWAETVGRLDEAEQAYRTALRGDPFDRKAHYRLGRLLRSRGQADEAQQHESQARDLDDAREQLAAGYLAAGRQRDDPTAELCAEFSRLCQALGYSHLSALWAEEQSRREVGPK